MNQPSRDLRYSESILQFNATNTTQHAINIDKTFSEDYPDIPDEDATIETTVKVSKPANIIPLLILPPKQTSPQKAPIIKKATRTSLSRSKTPENKAQTEPNLASTKKNARQNTDPNIRRINSRDTFAPKDTLKPERASSNKDTIEEVKATTSPSKSNALLPRSQSNQRLKSQPSIEKNLLTGASNTSKNSNLSTPKPTKPRSENHITNNKPSLSKSKAIKSEAIIKEKPKEKPKDKSKETNKDKSLKSTTPSKSQLPPGNKSTASKTTLSTQKSPESSSKLNFGAQLHTQPEARASPNIPRVESKTLGDIPETIPDLTIRSHTPSSVAGHNMHVDGSENYVTSEYASQARADLQKLSPKAEGEEESYDLGTHRDPAIMNEALHNLPGQKPLTIKKNLLQEFGSNRFSPTKFSPEKFMERISKKTEDSDEILLKKLKGTSPESKKVTPGHSRAHSKSPGPLPVNTDPSKLPNGQPKPHKKYHVMQKEIEEVANLTFKPAINKHSSKIIQQKKAKILDVSNGTNTSAAERLYQFALHKREKSTPNLLNHTANNETALDFNKTLHMDKPLAPFPFTPQINAKSKNLQRNEKVEDLLTKVAHRRTKSAEQRKQVKIPPVPNFTTTKSEELAANKLIKEFEEYANLFFSPEREHRFSYTQMQEFLRQLFFIHEDETKEHRYSLKERSLLYELWMILRGDTFKGINERNLLVFLLAIMGLNKTVPLYKKPENLETIPIHTELEQHTFSDTSNNPFNDPKKDEISLNNDKIKKELSDEGRDPLRVGSFDQTENVSFTVDEQKKIRVHYDLFYRTRVYLFSRHQKHIHAKVDESLAKETTFQPEILGVSKVLAQQYREKQLKKAAEVIQEKEIKVAGDGLVTHAELLLLHNLSNKSNLEKKRIEFDKKNLEKCTFQPKTNSYKPSPDLEFSEIKATEESSPKKNTGFNHRYEKLYNEGLEKQNHKPREDKSSIDYEYERNAKQLTFNPVINQKKPKDFQEPVKDSDKSVSRLKKARIMKAEAQKKVAKTPADFYFPILKFTMEKDAASYKGHSRTNSTVNNSMLPSEPSKQKVPNNSSITDHRNKGDSQTIILGSVSKDSKHKKDPEQDKDTVSELLREYREDTDPIESQGDQEVPPLLYVDVNFGVGKVQRIVIKEGDTSEEVAEKFAKEHNLSEVLKNKLKTVLDGHIKGLLSKIEEEGTMTDFDTKTSGTRDLRGSDNLATNYHPPLTKDVDEEVEQLFVSPQKKREMDIKVENVNNLTPPAKPQKAEIKFFDE